MLLNHRNGCRTELKALPPSLGRLEGRLFVRLVSCDVVLNAQANIFYKKSLIRNIARCYKLVLVRCTFVLGDTKQPFSPEKGRLPKDYLRAGTQVSSLAIVSFSALTTLSA